ncbi:hypothetical protein SJPD1_0063 [Sulfurospirillum diekertiae]|uniref:CobQ/CobB/MinD/ParA nucleotide binding domain-containing protein n=1 Tax=Sulfurospirillum diekertiae TaxID=1854492 RepID=A0A290H9Q5_9BACT|nr:ParA family protein [Sulfurospirillum diekertiae]ATB68197.1 hypothetical protein SJPD1_0063 [Sulfurospirillum diekertiae]
MKNIAIINTKGGVGKSTLAFHVLPAILADRNFEIIEIDNNNKTTTTFLNTQILKGKITSLNIAEGTQKLEELVVTNMLDEDKISVIDAGGGDDSLKVIHSFIDQDLIADTLFIIPFMPDFVQLKNLVDTYNVLPDTAKILVVLNNADLSDPDHLMFIKGHEDYEIPDMESTFTHFAVCPKSPLFSYAASRNKETIKDLALLASQYNKNEILEYAKVKTKANRDSMTKIYRNWKISRNAKDYIESEAITQLKSIILGEQA